MSRLQAKLMLSRAENYTNTVGALT